MMAVVVLGWNKYTTPSQ